MTDMEAAVMITLAALAIVAVILDDWRANGWRW
jgi:hypothetical protein